MSRSICVKPAVAWFKNWDFRVTRRDKLGHHSDDDLEPSLHFWLGLLEALKS